MALIATTAITEAAALLDLEGAFTAAAGGGDTVTYTDRSFIAVKNGSGSPITVTVAKQTNPSPLSGFGAVTKANFTMTIAAGDIGISPMFNQCFKNASGLLAVTYSSATDVSLKAFSMEALT